MHPCWFDNSLTSVVAAFSLAGFVLGIIMGRLIPRRGAQPRQRPAQSARKSGADRDRQDGTIEIYVGNLSYEVAEKDMADAFGQYGKVAGVRLIQNRFNGKSKGFGFVEMTDRAEAEKAIRAMNGREFKGRKIVANEARERSR